MLHSPRGLAALTLPSTPGANLSCHSRSILRRQVAAQVPLVALAPRVLHLLGEGEGAERARTAGMSGRQARVA